MKKQLTLLTVIGFLALSAGGVISAQESENSKNSFIESLAQKLELPTERVEEAVDQTREEIHSQKITESVENGDLTQRQADILDALGEIREERRASDEERPDSRDELHSELIDALSEKGIENVTSDELEELHETLRDLGVAGGHHRRHHFSR